MIAKHYIAHLDINADTWTEIVLETELSGGSVLVQCRTAVDVLISDNSEPGEDYFTLKSGQVLEVSTSGTSNLGLYAKSSSGSVILEIFEARIQI